MRRSARGKADDLAAHLAAIEAMDAHALRAEWKRRFKGKPHDRISADLLRRAIAYRVQEAALGGLPADMAQRLGSAGTPGALCPTPAVKPGTTMMREWHGRTHTVRALESGFEYEGRQYRSLSVIAREITGTAWSGPRFFGLLARPNGRQATVTRPDV